MSKTLRKKSSVNLMSEDEVKCIGKVVNDSANLRDQSLFAMLVSGLQEHIFLGAKASEIEDIATRNRLKAVTIKGGLPLYGDEAGILERYVGAEKLSPNDYLFPSEHDPERPMSSRELLRIFKSWEDKAQLPPAQRRPRALNDFYLIQLMLKSSEQPSLSDLITAQSGHKSPFMTEHYVQLVSKQRLSSKEDGTLED
jgi:integrase